MSNSYTHLTLLLRRTAVPVKTPDMSCAFVVQHMALRHINLTEYTCYFHSLVHLSHLRNFTAKGLNG
jgi:hypothetical protein